MTLLSSILFFVLAISPLVFIHEMGHYLVGRWCGVKAEAFSIGFGRGIVKWRDKRGTAWQIGWLPLGGYVRFAGDMGVSSQPDPDWLNLPAEERNQTFPSKPVWKRALIVLAGPLTNFLFAIIVMMGFFSVYGEPIIPPEVGIVAPHSAAQVAGIKPGDRILTVNGNAIERFEDIGVLVQVRTGQPTTFEVERGTSRQTLTITPRSEIQRDIVGAETRVGRIGIAPARRDFVKRAPYELPGAALRFTVSSVKMMATTLGQVVTGQRSFQDMGGPVKMAAASGKVAELGALNFLLFMTMISINLGFINLLPIPMLDGGHLVFYAIEAVRRKPVPEAAQEWAYRTGLVALLTFMVIVTVNDLAGLGLWRGIAGLIG